MPEHLRYPLIMRTVMSTSWAILPAKLDAIMEFIAFKAAGGELTAEEIRSRLGAASDRQRAQPTGDVAVMPMLGTISHRMGLLSESSGGTSVESMSKQFRALVRDPSVSAIVLDVDSPGGSVDGIDEFSSEIYRARGTKPITAVANTLAASAAYWLATAADELVVTPSAEVGSIGVIAGHEDRSGLYEQMGVKVSLVSAGKYKAENNPFEPMTEEGQAAIQKRVDEHYGAFTRAVARNRGVAVDAVRNGFGEGRIVGAREAIGLGMADRIATIDEVIATIPSKRESGTSALNAGAIPLTYEQQGERIAADLASFMQASRDRRDLLVSQGRVFSMAQRGRLLDVSGTLLTIVGELSDLLAETDPESDAKAMLAAFDQMQWRARLRDAEFALIEDATG